MTEQEKYDFIDHVVHLTLFAEDRLLNEHGGEYSGLEEAGIDSNEYYRIITERVIDILKKNNKYMPEEPVTEDLEEAAKYHRSHGNYGGDINLAMEESFKVGAQWNQKICKQVVIAELERRRDEAMKRQENLERIGQETHLNEMLARQL